MNIIVGASGQIGSYLIRELKNSGAPLRAVVRNPGKLQDQEIEFRQADLFDADQLLRAFEGGTTAFLLTPESQTSQDILGDTRRIIENYRAAAERSNLKKIVGLSCVGAHLEGDTGNILMSRMLEQGLGDLPVQTTFIRPSYYYSNWLGYLELIREHGILPSFFPDDLSVEMNSPIDVAKFIAKAMLEDNDGNEKKVYELSGQAYSSSEVARCFSKLLSQPVQLQVIPSEQWLETLVSAGFSENTAENLADMTRAVTENTAVPERPETVVRLPTTLEDYLSKSIV